MVVSVVQSGHVRLMIPTYERFFVPVLRSLNEGASTLESVADSVALALSLSPKARREVVPYDGEPVFRARTRLALTDLRRAGLVQATELGFELTEPGQQRLAGPELTVSGLETYPDYAAYRAKYLARRGA